MWGFVLALFYFETKFYYVVWLAWNSLCRLIWLGTCGQSSCLYLLGVGITGLQHISTHWFILPMFVCADMHTRLNRNSSFNHYLIAVSRPTWRHKEAKGLVPFVRVISALSLHGLPPPSPDSRAAEAGAICFRENSQTVQVHLERTGLAEKEKVTEVNTTQGQTGAPLLRELPGRAPLRQALPPLPMTGGQWMSSWALWECGEMAGFVEGMNYATLGARAWPGRPGVLAMLPSACHMPSARCEGYRKAASCLGHLSHIWQAEGPHKKNKVWKRRQPS